MSEGTRAVVSKKASDTHREGRAPSTEHGLVYWCHLLPHNEGRQAVGKWETDLILAAK